MKKRLLKQFNFHRAAMTLFLPLLTVTTAWAWDGSGTSDDPYLITNAEDLNQLATDVNGGNSYSGKYFEMTNDIQFTGGSNNFTSIGGYYGGGYKYFSGHFDGKGNKVSGIEIFKGGTDLSDCFQGLFGCIKTEGNNIAEVKNIILDDVNITGNSACGGIVGHVIGGTVENCHVTENVKINAFRETASYNGGIVGINDGIVTGCTSAAQITASSNSASFFGGIVGHNKGTVSDCFYYGGAIGGKDVATIAAQNSGTVSNCYSTRVDINGRQIKIANGGTVENCDFAYIITLGPGVTCSGNALTVGGFTLATEGQTVNLGYTGTVPEGYVLIYTANNGTISGNATSGYTLTVNGDGGVTATVTPTSGNCGKTSNDNVTWAVTDEDHDDIYETITISGTGEMADYDAYNQPWAAFESFITTAIIGDGVTSISERAFYNYHKLATVSGASGVTFVGNDAFYDTAWLNNLPDGLTYVGNVAYTFKGDDNSVELDASTTQIAYHCFYDCSELSMIYCLATTAPALGSDNAFDDCDDKLVIVVPADAYDSYTSGWSKYSSKLIKGYSLTCGTDVTATTANNGPLVQEDEEVTLGYTGTVPDGSVFGGYYYGSNLTRNDTFDMPAEDVTVTAAIAPLSGNCGTTDHEADVTWALTDEDKDGTYDKLTISGTGAMADYDADNQPWAVLKSDINTLIVGEGVTAIGSNAFTGCTNLERAYILPTTVPATSSNVFDGCDALFAIVVPGVARDRYWSDWYGKNDYPYAHHIIEGYTITCAAGITVTSEYNGPLVQNNEVVTITNTVPSVAPEGYEAPFLGYKVMDTNNLIQSVTEEAGVYTFPMPDCYATVVPAWTTIPWEGSGSATDPYIIEYASQLDLLAERVNSGTDPTDTKKYEDYTDTYFELGRDIEYAHTTDWDDAASTEKNFTSIGCYKHTTGIYYAERSFNGHFDGKGHRISGIRIFSRSNSYCIAGYEGIFGNIGPSATVSGIILDDTRITGHCYIGGIAGHNDGIISDCHVTDKVNIHVITDGSTIFGGIAGSNNDGTISGCTSAVSITSTTANSPNPYKIGTRIGGIAGANYSTLKDCLFLGTTLEGEEMLGAIVGSNGEGSSVENCYYTSTAIQSTLGGSGNGSTVTNCGLALGGNLDYNAFLAAMAARTAALTAVERKQALNTDVAITYKRSFTEETPSTVCLPFDYTPDDTDGRFYYFVGITKEDDQYVATMKENTVKALTANTPYLFLPAATGEVDFSGDYTIKESKDAPSTTSDDWTFLGTYDEVKWDEAPTGIYGFSAQAVDDQGISQGEFVKVGAKVKIRPFRAYLKYKDGSENYSGARAFTRSDADELPASITVRLVDSKGNTTAIGTIDTNTGEVNIDRDGWYTLSGRRLPNKPTQRGIYINNGNKVLIK